MNITIKGNHLEVTPAIENYIYKKLSFLDKTLEEEICDVEVQKTNEKTANENVFRVEINIAEKNIFVSSEKPDLYSAIDHVKDEVEKMLVSKKEKKMTLFRKGALRVKNIIKGVYNYPADKLSKFRGRFGGNLTNKIKNQIQKIKRK